MRAAKRARGRAQGASEASLTARTLRGGAHGAQESGQLGDGDLVQVVDRGDDVNAQGFVAKRFGEPVEFVDDTFPSS
jgi:hypothetical protein